MAIAGLLSALAINIFLAFVDKLSVNEIEDGNEVFIFSMYKTLLCGIFALVTLPLGNMNINVVGVVIAVGAGIFHASSVVLIMQCLKQSRMVYVNLFIVAGMIIPAVFGWVLMNQSFSISQVICLTFLIFSFVGILNVKNESKINLKLFIYLFISYGMLMLMQAMFPQYCEKGSKLLFSVIMYGFSFMILVIFIKIKGMKMLKMRGKLKVFLTISAILNLAINVILTTVSGVLDAVIVFPVVHGLKFVIITLLSPFIVKEKLNAIQIAGCFVAIVCICIIVV